ncbi:MAG: hypothetical protein V7K40_06765 [Nostoc sp.]|uniref:hypothetical protein n=1 Tax=Nostoc sp. TaxID=1180 RepID=UPI002FFA44CF
MILVLRPMNVSPLILVTHISRIQILRSDVYDGLFGVAIAQTPHHNKYFDLRNTPIDRFKNSQKQTQ